MLDERYFDARVHAAPSELRPAPGALHLLLVTGDFAPRLAEIAAHMAPAPFYGAVVPYLIHDRRLVHSGLMVLSVPTVRARAFMVDMRAGAAEIAQRMQGWDAMASLLLFVDGLSAHMDDFVEALQGVAVGRPVLGTGVGHHDLVQRPSVFAGEDIRRDAALVVGLDSRLHVAARHGWRPLHGPLVVTRAAGNILYELNGQPAFDVYRDTLRKSRGVDITRDAFFDVAKSHPFGISQFQGGEIVIRDPLDVQPDGSLVIVSSVRDMDILYVMQGDADELLASSARLGREVLGRSPARQALLFDCISRVLFLEDGFSREIDAVVREARAPDLSLLGLTSVGELTNVGYDRIRVLNKTTLLGLVHRD